MQLIYMLWLAIWSELGPIWDCSIPRFTALLQLCRTKHLATREERMDVATVGSGRAAPRRSILL
jgi:hypothetical protein